jgi:hypothetical protein
MNLLGSRRIPRIWYIELRLSVKIGVDEGRRLRWLKATDRPTSSARLIVFEGPRPHGSILKVRVARGGL